MSPVSAAERLCRCHLRRRSPIVDLRAHQRDVFGRTERARPEVGGGRGPTAARGSILLCGGRREERDGRALRREGGPGRWLSTLGSGGRLGLGSSVSDLVSTWLEQNAWPDGGCLPPRTSTETATGGRASPIDGLDGAARPDASWAEAPRRRREENERWSRPASAAGGSLVLGYRRGLQIRQRADVHSGTNEQICLAKGYHRQIIEISFILSDQ